MLGLSVFCCLDQGEEQDLFSGHGAEIVVQAQHLDARNFPNRCCHNRPRRFDQMRPYLLEQVPPLLVGERRDELLFRNRQRTLQTDEEKIADEVCMNVASAPGQGSRAQND